MRSLRRRHEAVDRRRGSAGGRVGARPGPPRSGFEAGCQVFLTGDKDILRCHDFFAGDGLAILSPTALLERLDEAGELDDTAGPASAPFPDASVLARLYGGFGD